MGKKTILLVTMAILGTFLLSSCFMANVKPIVSGYVQYYDGSNFSTDNISVELQVMGEGTSEMSTTTAKANSKGYYAFTKVPTLDSTNIFYCLYFKKPTSMGTKTAAFEFSSSPFFSAMTTIFNKTDACLTIEATHTDSSKGSPEIEIKDKDNGKLLFARLFQWKWEDGTYNDIFDLPYGTYEVSLRYMDSKDGEFLKTTTVTLDTTQSSTTITFDLSK